MYSQMNPNKELDPNALRKGCFRTILLGLQFVALYGVAYVVLAKTVKYSNADLLSLFINGSFLATTLGALPTFLLSGLNAIYLGIRSANYGSIPTHQDIITWILKLNLPIIVGVNLLYIWIVEPFSGANVRNSLYNYCLLLGIPSVLYLLFLISISKRFLGWLQTNKQALIKATKQQPPHIEHPDQSEWGKW